jgi:hypothetical protein
VQLHTGVNYYYFNDAITTLTAKWVKQDILQLLNEGKIDTRFINASDFLISLALMLGLLLRLPDIYGI